jgi:hypothetical protein
MDAHCVRCGKVMGDSWVEVTARAMAGVEYPLCFDCRIGAAADDALRDVDRRVSELHPVS